MVKVPRRRHTASPDGRMTLTEHLRELRNRLFISYRRRRRSSRVIGWVFYDPIFDFLHGAGQQGHRDASRPRVTTSSSRSSAGSASAFRLQIKIAGIIGVICACPVWLYQLWRFVTPGLHRNERR